VFSNGATQSQQHADLRGRLLAFLFSSSFNEGFGHCCTPLLRHTSNKHQAFQQAALTISIVVGLNDFSVSYVLFARSVEIWMSRKRKKGQ